MLIIKILHHSVNHNINNYIVMQSAKVIAFTIHYNMDEIKVAIS